MERRGARSPRRLGRELAGARREREGGAAVATRGAHRAAEIVFREGLDFDLGGVRIQVRHVGGDHADDSTVMYVDPDGVLFLGDCLYEAPPGGYTAERLLLLVGAVRSFAAELFVEGHSETVLSAAELDELIAEASATVE